MVSLSRITTLQSVCAKTVEDFLGRNLTRICHDKQKKNGGREIPFQAEEFLQTK